MSKFSHLLISKKTTLIESMRRMDDVKGKLLIIQNNNKFYSLISIGDIQRAIINNIDLSSPVTSIDRTTSIVGYKTDSRDEIKDKLYNLRAEFLPVIDSKKNIIDLFFWIDFFPKNSSNPKKKLSNEVVIMAGGLGTRVKPLTNVIPKAMLPVNDKSFLEEIMFRFSEYSINRFHVSVNHKSDLIKFYIKNLKLPYNINFFSEDSPRGTIGGVKSLKGKFNSPFFVSNCDILIDSDYSEIVKFHEENNFDITIVGAVLSDKSEYGKLNTGKNGEMISIEEKPISNHKINTGVYLLEPNVIDLIPASGIFHITDLMELVKKNDGKVGVFPVSSGSWKDFGTLKSYLNHILVN